MSVRLDKINLRDGSSWQNLRDLIYPIGSFYMSTEATSPSILFGGTWVAVEGRMIIGANSTYTVNAIGGSATTTIASSNLPKHTHSVGAHSHGLNSHTHTLSSHTHSYSKANSPTGNVSLNLKQIPWCLWSSNRDTNKGAPNYTNKHIIAAGGDYGAAASPDVTTGNAHNHTIGFTATNSGGPSNNTSGAASGSTANSTAFNTSDGGFANSAMTTISPYYAAYIWRRTA